MFNFPCHKKNPNFSKGLTLVELLLVISLIGLLSSIILVNVWRAQLQAKDAIIQEHMFNIRTMAEKDFFEDGDYDNVCQEEGDENGNSRLNIKEKKKKGGGDYQLFNDQIKNINGGLNVTCNEGFDSGSYAAWSPLVYASGHYWCVDSQLVGRDVAGVPAADSTVCPN